MIDIVSSCGVCPAWRLSGHGGAWLAKQEARRARPGDALLRRANYCSAQICSDAENICRMIQMLKSSIDSC